MSVSLVKESVLDSCSVLCKSLSYFVPVRDNDCYF